MTNSPLDKSEILCQNHHGVEKLYSKQEVCVILGISLSKLNDLINKRLVEAKKLGRRTVFTSKAINEFIDNLQDYTGGCSSL